MIELSLSEDFYHLGYGLALYGFVGLQTYKKGHNDKRALMPLNLKNCQELSFFGAQAPGGQLQEISLYLSFHLGI